MASASGSASATLATSFPPHVVAFVDALCKEFDDNADGHKEASLKVIHDSDMPDVDTKGKVLNAYWTRRNVKDLNLERNELSDGGAQAIGTALASNSTLTTLNLYGNDIEDEGGVAIGNGLATNTTLTTLHLDENSIGDEGAKAIGAALAANTALTTLELGENMIGYEGAEAIAAGIAVNSVLTTLSLDGCDFSAHFTSSIQAALDRNKTS